MPPFVMLNEVKHLARMSARLNSESRGANQLRPRDLHFVQDEKRRKIN